jgi:hypothetical protein
MPVDLISGLQRNGMPCDNGKRVATFVTQVHLQLQGLELVGERRSGLSAHLLPSPLLEAIEFLVDEHVCGIWWFARIGRNVVGRGCCRERIKKEHGGGILSVLGVCGHVSWARKAEDNSTALFCRWLSVKQK